MSACFTAILTTLQLKERKDNMQHYKWEPVRQQVWFLNLNALWQKLIGRGTVKNVLSKFLFWIFSIFPCSRITSWRELFHCIVEQQKKNSSFALATGNMDLILQHFWQNAQSFCLGHWKGNKIFNTFITFPLQEQSNIMPSDSILTASVHFTSL